MASEGGKAGKGPGKGAAPPPAGGGGKGGGKAEREEARKKKREEEAAALKQKQAAEKAHMAFLDEVPQRKPADIGAVTWSEATRQVMLPGGTTLVELSNGHMVCLRRTPQTAAEFVASRVSIALGMKAPAFRVVLPDTEEYKQIEDMDQRTVTFVDDMPMTYENFISELNDANEGDIPTEVKRPLVQRYEFSSPARSTRLLGCSEKGKLNVVVQEFLPGKSLDQWGGQLSEVQLTALGRLCALDALLNQDDQLAFPVWKESGKLTNIMAGGSPDMLVGIDQEVRPILDSNLEGYQARLRAMVSLLLDGSGDQEPITGYDISAKAAIVSNRELFQKSGFELDDANMAIFMDGVKAGFEHIASSWNSGVLQNAVLDAERAAAAGVAPYDGAFSAEQCAELVRSNAAVVASVGGLQTPIARETSSQQAAG
eukprot:TRINITY_DN721_c0_g2_i2.p1 TRINITY_DN721_c0_g2~~TRINITY_DN721_c0_g2_i2.p1  ORF type:complete len:448 (-),score=101.62 TRINITY_DN721_c0_g2_i2:324-1604(-)